MKSETKPCFGKMIFLLLFLFTVVTQASAQDWVQLSPAGNPPPARGFHGVSTVYDSSNNRMIVFGGRINDINNSNDVWALTNANGVGGTGQWINLIPDGAPSSPAPRSGHSAVYDSASNRMVIFGGCNGYCLPTLNDVWVLTNANGLGGTPAWIQLFPAGGAPSPRVKHTAVYDSATNRMIVFGGQDGSAFGCSTYPDVWVLSNANGLGGTPTWTQLSPTGGPAPGQYGASAVYDPVSNRMVVFGGMGFVGASCQVTTNAVWVLTNANGNSGTPAWINLIAEGAAGSPPARFFHTAVYDTSDNRMIVFAGAVANDYLNDVWALANATGLGRTPTWTQLSPSGGLPATRSGHGAVFDTATKRMTIFAGNHYNGVDYPTLNDTWVLTVASDPCAQQVQNLLSQINSLTQQNAALQAQVNDLTAQNTQLLTQVNALTAANSQLSAQVNQLQGTVSQQQGQLAQLQSQLGAADQTIQSQQAQIDQLQSVIDGFIAAVQGDFRSEFNDPQFTAPGASSSARLQNILNAILSLNHGRKQGLYTNLGGKP